MYDQFVNYSGRLYRSGKLIELRKLFGTESGYLLTKRHTLCNVLGKPLPKINTWKNFALKFYIF
jgi:hypothetical protein